MLDTLPDSLLLKIFNYLPPHELGRISQVCRTFDSVSKDGILWRAQFHRYFKITEFHSTPVVEATWKNEFVRLIERIPRIETQALTRHSDQVLHVSWSHDGRRFATASKDVSINLWNATAHPILLESTYSMKDFSWKYTQFSQFNSTDTLLLVSGVLFGLHSTSGEIAVFSLEGPEGPGLQIQCRIMNKPYDVFGTWYSEKYLLSGEFHTLAPYTSDTSIWCNIASQETESEHSAVMNKIFRFYNPKASSVRSLLIANIESPGTPEPETPVSEEQSESEGDEESCSNSLSVSQSSASQQEYLTIEPNEKWLIFTCGSQTYTPHKIGFKKIPPLKFKRKLELGLSLQERIQAQKLRKELEAAQAQAAEDGDEPPGEPAIDYEDWESVKDKFDTIDHTLDLHGHIIGMALSPDHKYLYVNSRPWPQDYVISDPFYPPPIAQQIDVHIISLETLTEVGKLSGSHRAFTPNEECFFIFLDVGDHYVGSGAEDRFGYLWERNYNLPLCKYPHSDVVNCVGFCPTNSQILVTVSDDNTIKIWRSKEDCEKLGIDWKGEGMAKGTLLNGQRQ